MGATYRAINNAVGQDNGAPTVALTPATGDLFIVFVVAAKSGGAPACTVTDDNGSGTYTLIDTATGNPASTSVYAYVRNALLNDTTSTTVTATFTGGGTGVDSEVAVVAIAGMARDGSTGAILQSANGHGASGAPSATFASASLTANALLGVVGDGSNPATVTPRASFTERLDTGDGFNFTRGIEVMTCDSGLALNTVTWGSSVASGWGAIILELDTSLTPINGTVSQTLGTATGAATAQVQVHGTASKTLGAATLAATGEVPGKAHGTVGATLDDASAAATGAVVVAASVGKTLDDATLDATAENPPITGPFSRSFPASLGFDVSLDRVRFRFRP